MCVCVLVYAVHSGPVSGCGVLCLGVCLYVGIGCALIHRHLCVCVCVCVGIDCALKLSEPGVCVCGCVFWY